ncbi:transaldolase [Flavobacterium sp. ASW18X]|uniref:TlpA family protein disulfide reductase n=1 Tax=Flavobacterium sp. ASW18X TaxID=2572595 RepID=UPI0010AEB4FC|nr:transaldolase [Flavobacterium sp. ASW18X]TKD65880.1 transaldolase [Flavobacterium sp. ASW18X]
MNRLLPLLFLWGLVACKKDKTDKDLVFFAGEIVNPSSQHVVLYKNNEVVDSAALDPNNRFAFKLKNIDEGLYHFNHAPQYQYVYLEKGDSVLIRLNATPSYFDESLVFSGSNEEVNNFMIEMFLTYEDEDPLVRSFYSLPPADFSKKIDSLKEMKLVELKTLTGNNANLTDKAMAIAKAAVLYNSYLYKEKYPFYHKKYTGENTLHNLSDDFYDYRKTLDLNNEELSYFRPYYDFLKFHFGNLSYMACHKECATEEGAETTTLTRLHHNKHKLSIIDSIVVEEKLRNNLFRNIAMDYLLKEHEASESCRDFIREFEELCTNPAYVTEINDLYGNIKSLQAENTLPELTVQCVQGIPKTLSELAKDRKTVFYFWTADRKRHFRNATNRINKLEQEYPDIQFIGINLKTGNDEWQKLMAEKNMNTKNQYWASDFEMAQKKLIVDNLNKCILAKDAKVVNGFSNIYQPVAIE